MTPFTVVVKVFTLLVLDTVVAGINVLGATCSQLVPFHCIKSPALEPAAMFSKPTAPFASSSVVMASSAIFAFVIALSAMVNVTSFNVEFTPPVTSISLEVILPSPVKAETSTSNAPDAFCTNPVPATSLFIFSAFTASSASCTAETPPAVIPNVKGLTVVPNPEIVNVPSVAPVTSLPITPSFSVTVTEPRSTKVQEEVVSSHCITWPSAVPFANFSKETASSAISVVVIVPSNISLD